MVNWSTAGQI